MRKILGSLTIVGAGLALALAPAAAAQAADLPPLAALPSPICNNVVVAGAGGHPVPVPAANSVQRCYMQRGDGKTDTSSLRTMQAAINICYIQKGRLGNMAPLSLASPDTFGPKTEAAVKAVQRWHGITADGGWGPQTRSVMQWPDNDTLACRTVPLS
ncbi:peptidoglycan-binding protein [Actinoplanes sp. TRM 88003]|uniref:Peptidoglycan-binding protein n=1 Tax=Paractinoplanes aksuensis TaxID=2939490 RepID=A0ABT1DVX7_9ACTN|nr:peptidoglycan-binding protein [Actinoplanes aksuensis]MCO8273806.1 peptidoglycan-binding protein [Actinoplanes aksuensis]